MANLMMAEANSTKRPMISMTGRLGDMKLVDWGDLDREIAGLAKYICCRPKERFLVLVPRRFIGKHLAEAIGSDAMTAFSDEPLTNQITQEAFATASLLADPEDYVAVRAFFSFHGAKRKHGLKYNAEAYASIPAVGGHDLVRRVADGTISLAGGGKEHIRNRAKQAVDLIERSMTANEIIDFVFNEASAEDETNLDKRRWLIDDLRELKIAAQEMLAMQNSPDLSKVIATLRYRIATRTPLRTEQHEPRVKIMTLHSAKGLEEDNVIISGLADQFMPGLDRDDPAVVEEQRRLLYVAATRAKSSLIISWPRRIRLEDIFGNGGRKEQIRTFNGERWSDASSSSLLPQGLTGVIDGSNL